MNTSHVQTPGRKHIWRRIAAAGTVVAVTAALSLMGAGSATAAESDPVAQAEGQFLSGSVLNLDLDSVAAVSGATAVNYGNEPTATEKDPLAVTVLDSQTIGNGDSVQGNVGGDVQIGVAGQYAQATPSGESTAAAGAITSDGAIGVGHEAGPGGDATVDLGALLGANFASSLTDLDLAVKALAAQAHAEGKVAAGDYTLADVNLQLSSPAISQLTNKVNAALESVETNLALLDADNGVLVAELNKVLQGIDPSLNLLGANANVTASIDAGDLRHLVSDLLTDQYGESGVTFNLETGVVTLDLAKLAGVDLNNLPPGTELLSDAVVGEALDNIVGKVALIANQVVDRIREALHDATVDIHAVVSADAAPLVRQICQTVQRVIQVPTPVVTQVPVQVPVVNGVVGQIVNGVPVIEGIPVVNGVLSEGGLIGGLFGSKGQQVTWITQYVSQTVTRLLDRTVSQQVCTDKSTALPDLETSATVDLTGTVDEFIHGVGVDSSANVMLLGAAEPEVNLDLAIDGMGDSLAAGLFGGDGAVADLTGALQARLVDPAADGLLEGDNSVNTALTDMVSLRANVQDINDGMFSETALRTSVLGDGGAVINLARASVGPNVTTIADCLNPAGCGVGGNVMSLRGGGGGIGGGAFGGGGSSGGGGAVGLAALALTGGAMTALIALIATLLAVGTFLLLENRRRNHPQATPIHAR